LACPDWILNLVFYDLLLKLLPTAAPHSLIYEHSLQSTRLYSSPPMFSLENVKALEKRIKNHVRTLLSPSAHKKTAPD
jgi:hypothetical protein